MLGRRLRAELRGADNGDASARDRSYGDNGRRFHGEATREETAPRRSAGGHRRADRRGARAGRKCRSRRRPFDSLQEGEREERDGDEHQALESPPVSLLEAREARAVGALAEMGAEAATLLPAEAIVGSSRDSQLRLRARELLLELLCE
jgi:hypothetical protein